MGRSVDFGQLAAGPDRWGCVTASLPPDGGPSAPQARRTLDPKLDVVFKLLFTRNPDLLVSLLTAVLRPAVPIVSVTLKDRALPKTAVLDKGGFLDVLVELQGGELVDVEMQCRALPGRRRRTLLYWARLYGAQGGAGRLHESWPTCVCVFILAFQDLPGERFHRIFQVRDVDDGEVFSDALELHTVELPNLPPRGADAEEPELVRWGRFLAASSDEELEELAMTDPVMGKAKEALEALSADPAAQELARQRELRRLSYELEMAESRPEGRQQGIEQGIEQGRTETLRAAIEGLCEVLDIRVDAARRERLAGMKLAQLEQLHETLRTRRCWPDG